MLIEACVDSVESAVAAELGGAERVELCQALLEGGLTPSLGAVERARERLSIGLHVIVRPRGGDFLYTEDEHALMLADIGHFKRAGADGVVVGILAADGTIDRDRTAALVDEARPMSVTYHRAFDMVRDPWSALDTLVEIGIDRVLTSGQEESAMAGLDRLKALVDAAGDRIGILPAGNIHESNIERIVARTGAHELHVTAFMDVESGMEFRNPRVYMGGTLRPPEYSRSMTDSASIRRLVNLTGE